MSARIGESLHILQHVASRAEGVTEESVLDALGLTARVGQRLVAELVDLSYLSFTDASERVGGGGLASRSRTLMLGPSAIALAGRVEKHFPFTSIARGPMLELMQSTQETVAINKYFPSLRAGVCMAVEEGPHPLGYVIDVGEIKPLHAGASGKTLLAGLNEQELMNALGHGPLLAVTPATITDIGRLREELAVVREQGFCLTHGERIVGAVGIGVPLPLGVSQTAALVVTIPEFRFDPATASELVARVRATARAIADAVSCEP